MCILACFLSPDLNSYLSKFKLAIASDYKTNASLIRLNLNSKPFNELALLLFRSYCINIYSLFLVLVNKSLHRHKIIASLHILIELVQVFGDFSTTMAKALNPDPDFVFGNVVAKCYDMFGEFFLRLTSR